MSSQSHVSHCRVLPLDEFNLMIPEPHATLQDAVTWRNQCHDRATLQGLRIPSAILKIVFTIFFLFLVQFGFDERRLLYRLRYAWYCYCSLSIYGPLGQHGSDWSGDLATTTLTYHWSTRLRLIMWPCELHLDLPIRRLNCWWWCCHRHGFQMTFQLPSPLRKTGFSRFIMISQTVTDWFSWHVATWLMMTRHWIKTLWERSSRHPDLNSD